MKKTDIKTINQRALHKAIRFARQHQRINIYKPIATKKRWFWHVTKPIGKLFRKLSTNNHDFSKGEL